MILTLGEDVILVIISFLHDFIIHNVKFIKHKLLNLDLLCLKKTNKYIYDIIEKEYIKKYNYKNIYVIDNSITEYYIDIINTLYFNEISKIGNIQMFNEIQKKHMNNQGIKMLETAQNIIKKTGPIPGRFHC